MILLGTCGEHTCGEHTCGEHTCGEQSESNPNDEIRMTKPGIVGDNIGVPGSGPQPWMLELAKMLILKDLPTGVIVGIR